MCAGFWLFCCCFYCFFVFFCMIWSNIIIFSPPEHRKHHLNLKWGDLIFWFRPISCTHFATLHHRGCIDFSRVLEPEIKKNWSSTKKASSFTTKLDVYLIPNSNFGDIRDPYSRGQTSMNFENFPYLLVSRFQAKSPLMTLWRPPCFATFLWRIETGTVFNIRDIYFYFP